MKTSKILLDAHRNIAKHERKKLNDLRPNSTKASKDSLQCPFCGTLPELTTFDDGSQLIGCVNWRCGGYLHRMPPHYWGKRYELSKEKL